MFVFIVNRIMLIFKERQSPKSICFEINVFFIFYFPAFFLIFVVISIFLSGVNFSASENRVITLARAQLHVWLVFTRKVIIEANPTTLRFPIRTEVKFASTETATFVYICIWGEIIFPRVLPNHSNETMQPCNYKSYQDDVNQCKEPFCVLE